jgi:hypothetical protein
VIFPPWLSPFTRTGGFATETEADPVAVRAVNPIVAKKKKKKEEKKEKERRKSSQKQLLFIFGRVITKSKCLTRASNPNKSTRTLTLGIKDIINTKSCSTTQISTFIDI